MLLTELKTSGTEDPRGAEACRDTSLLKVVCFTEVEAYFNTPNEDDMAVQGPDIHPRISQGWTLHCENPL